MMGRAWQMLLLMSALATCTFTFTCKRANWWGSFDNEGLSHCAGWHEYINGFWRNDAGGDDDKIYLLEEAECCDRYHPWTNSKSQVVNSDWWASFDHNNAWNYCPAGYFLHGLWRSGGGGDSWLYHIEEGRCMKPADHPNYHGHCYTHNVWGCFDNKGVCKCNDDYFVTGLFRGNCDKLYCLEELRCCKMASGPEALDEKYKVKTRIMDTTMSDMALLAHYLGYGWCAGCRSPWVGEDFRKNGDTWAADKSGRCSGYKSDHRLSMAFGDWKFGIKDIQYGASVINDLTPEVIDSGTLYNNDPNPVTKTITRSETSVRSVTHTTTSSWKHSHELGVEISYTPGATGGVGGSIKYTFGYEETTSTTDSTNNQQSKTFTVSVSKTIPGNSAVGWRLILSKTRTTVPYTATIITHFSTEFQGFLRWGGGYNGGSTNYHYQHRGSGDRPTFNYRFGDASTPFYTALKRQSDSNSHPWMWNDMKNKYSYAQNLINDLSNENRYTFTLTGKFDDIVGKHVDISWDAATGRKRRSGGDGVADLNKSHTHVATAGPEDPPSPNPDPPKVDIPPQSSEPAPHAGVLGN